MSQSRWMTSVALAALVLGGAAGSGCGRDADETAPVPEGRSAQVVDNLARPVTVTGCLRAGESSTTFVLTTSETREGQTRTYALQYPPETKPEDLRDHIGRQVQVEGVVRSQQAVTGATPSTPPANDPVGTGGDPEVRTTTTLAVEQLEVRTLRPLNEACPEA